MPTDKLSNTNVLNAEDIKKLIQSPFEKRIEITKRIAQLYTDGGFSDQQMQVAEQLFRTLIKDTEVEVRKTLAEAVKESKNAPVDLVLDLAKDIQEIAIPVLQFSEVLSDADLIEIIKTTEDVEKHVAVSAREGLSSSVSGALIESNNDKVINSLLQNDTAEVSEEGYNSIVQNFSDKQELMQAMVDREALPVGVVEHLAKTISNVIRDQLIEKHKDAFNKIDDVVDKTSDIATMKVMGLKNSDQEYFQFLELMRQLQVDENLIPISALCMGNINIFEVSIARRTKVPVANVRTLVDDQSNKGFKALYERAGLPDNLFQATTLLITVLRDMKSELNCDGLAVSQETSNRIIEGLMAQAEKGAHIENLDYILSLVRHNAVVSKQS